MILCDIFLTQGSSVMLWRHLKQSPTLDLFKNCYKSLLLILWNHIIPTSFRTHRIIIIKIKINPTHVPKSIPCRIFLSESLFIGYPYSFKSSFFILSLSFWKISTLILCERNRLTIPHSYSFYIFRNNKLHYSTP